MTEHQTTLETSWADGQIRIRPGESIRFTGSVTGIDLDDDIKLVFNADGQGTYRYSRGSIPDYADSQTQALIVMHVEQGLIDGGFDIDPKVAPDDYGETE